MTQTAESGTAPKPPVAPDPKDRPAELRRAESKALRWRHKVPTVIQMEVVEFASGFTGIILSFEKGPDFAPGGRQTKVGAALMQRRLPSGRALPLVLLASLLLVLPGIAAPGFSRVFIDDVLSGGRQD